jgi:hypothetical protein
MSIAPLKVKSLPIRRCSSQPSFEFVINLKTAKALDLTFRKGFSTRPTR